MNYSIETTTEPDAVDLVDELKSHLSLNNGTAEDTELQRFLNTARDMFEFETQGRIILPTVFTQFYPNWYNNHSLHVYGLPLARGKVISVASVKYYDEDDTQQTWSTSDWDVDTTGVPAVIYNGQGNYPNLSNRRPRPIEVVYTCGWADLDYVPDDIVLALLSLAGHFYNNREAFNDSAFEARTVPEGFTRICHKWRTGLGGI